MRILIADDHAVVRQGLKQILAEAFPQAQFGVVANAQQALEAVLHNGWDLLVADITMPGRSGLELLKDLKTAKPKLPVLILSVHSEDQFAVRVIKAGAAGFLNKDSAPEELVNAVKKVLAGGKYVSPMVAEQLATSLQTPGNVLPHELLSDREFEVLRRLANSQTVKQIAGELSLSVKTISTYRVRILAKMKLRTNAELMKYAVRQGLAE